MIQGPLTEESVQRVLADFRDPETGRGIAALGQIHRIAVQGDSVTVDLGLTSYSAPLWKETRQELAEVVKAKLPQVAEVTVNVVRHERPAEKIGEIGLAVKSVIAVGSGKGGVGKSTIAASVAYGLTRAGC